MARAQAKPQILHILPDNHPGAVTRTRLLVRALGSYRHRVVAPDTVLGELRAGNGGRAVEPVADFPELAGRPSLRKLQRLARAMSGYDLVATHGYSSINAAMARTVFAEAYAMPPVIHHEWDHKPVITAFARRRRNWFRRIAFGKLAAVVVDTERFEERALVDWQQPIGRVKLIGEGIDVRAYAKRPRTDALPNLVKRAGEHWLGVVDPAASMAVLEEALDGLADLSPEWHLVWATPGDMTEALGAAADARGLNHLAHNIAGMSDTARYMGLFDMLLVPQQAEGQGGAVLAAMASGLPVLGQAEVVERLAEPNALLLREGAKAARRTLAGDSALRQSVGEANRRLALAKFDQERTVDTYRRLFDSALALAQRTPPGRSGRQRA